MATRSRVRGNIERLPSGSYRAIVYAGEDPLTGRERRIKRTVKTRAEAKLELTRLQSQVDRREAPKSSITLGEAIEQWLEVAKLERTTRERYDDLIRLYIRPRLAKIQAGKLDAELLERLYKRLERCRDLCGPRPPKGHVCRPLSTSTTRKIHYIVRGALGNAVRWRYLGVNVAETAIAPSPAKAKPDPPSPAEAAAVLEEAWRDPEWGLLIWLTMVTGCRRGELCALRWSDLDVERATLWIQRAAAQTREGLLQKDTKTGDQRRISLDPHTMTLLADLPATQPLPGQLHQNSIRHGQPPVTATVPDRHTRRDDPLPDGLHTGRGIVGQLVQAGPRPISGDGLLDQAGRVLARIRSGRRVEVEAGRPHDSFPLRVEPALLLPSPLFAIQADRTRSSGSALRRVLRVWITSWHRGTTSGCRAHALPGSALR